MAKKTSDEIRLEKLRALKIGQSVFVKDGTQSSMQSLRRLCLAAGITISIYEIPNDLVHKCAGVRIFKVGRK